jgi:hypothetical protein
MISCISIKLAITGMFYVISEPRRVRIYVHSLSLFKPMTKKFHLWSWCPQKLTFLMLWNEFGGMGYGISKASQQESTIFAMNRERKGFTQRGIAPGR